MLSNSFRSPSLRGWLRASVLSLLLVCSSAALGGPRVEAVALFSGKAVLQIDGERLTLGVGETRMGVTLVAADSSAAVVRIDGARHRLSLSDRVGGAYSAPERPTVRIAKGAGGMYTAAGAINGSGIEFLVDTGATTVALNASHAGRLGIDYRERGVPVRVGTAGGTRQGYRLRLDRVSVGEIRLSNVTAVVIEGSMMPMPLLGMSFLGRVNMRHEGNMLILEGLR